MSERELLELAAKAAGVGPLDFDYAEREGHGFYAGPRLPMPQGVMMAAMWTYWNPLDNDGDALRLSVKLFINLRHMSFLSEDARTVQAGLCGDWFEGEKCATDPNAATRRAIVRAAAELGKAMP